MSPLQRGAFKIFTQPGCAIHGFCGGMMGGTSSLLSRLKRKEAKRNKSIRKQNIIIVYNNCIKIHFIYPIASTDCDPTMSSSLSNSSEAALARQPTKSMFLQVYARMCPNISIFLIFRGTLQNRGLLRKTASSLL